MISEVFNTLQAALIDYIRLASGFKPTETPEDQVVFLNGDAVNTNNFKTGAITMVLVNVEEDRKVLPADPYRRTLTDGSTVLVKAPVPLNLYALFVARYGQYLDSLRSLEFVVQFFQKYRVIDRTNMPNLANGIEKLVCELVTIPIHEHNHVWGNLNTPYQPSLLYRLRMVVFQDNDGIPLPRVASSQFLLTNASSNNRTTNVPLASKPRRWAYYCVTDLPDAVTALHIVETKSPNGEALLVFPDDARRNLKTFPDTSDLIGKHLVRRNADKQVVRFVSNALVPLSDNPRRYIELRLGTNVLSSPLANPSPSSVSSIDLSLPNGPANPCEVLSHIIEYHAQTNQNSQ